MKLLETRYHCGRSQSAAKFVSAHWNDVVYWSITVTMQRSILSPPHCVTVSHASPLSHRVGNRPPPPICGEYSSAASFPGGLQDQGSYLSPFGGFCLGFD